MTDSAPSPNSDVPYVGQRISLISKSAIRYVGTLYTIDTKASTVALKDVRSFGTEGRHRDGGPVEPSNRIYTFIVFRGPDITDLQFLPKDSDTPLAPHHPAQHPQTHPSDSHTVGALQVPPTNVPANNGAPPNHYNQIKAPDIIPHQQRPGDVKQNILHPTSKSDPSARQSALQSPSHLPPPIQQKAAPNQLPHSANQPSYPRPPQASSQPSLQPQSSPEQHQQPQSRSESRPQPQPSQSLQDPQTLTQQLPPQQNPSQEALQQKPIVRGPTPRAWGPPPVPPKEARQAHVDRESAHASAQRTFAANGNGLPDASGSNSNIGGGANGVPNGAPGGSHQAVHGNPHRQNGVQHAVVNGGAVGAPRQPRFVPPNHVRQAMGVGGVNGAAPAVVGEGVPPIAGGININGINGSVPGGPQAIHMNGDRGYRGGRGRGRGRGYGNRYPGGSWRRGPGIKIPQEDFDFASMQEKFEAATIGPGGKRGEEEALGHIEVCYDKSRSFFDDLVPEKEMRSERVNAAQRRATDFETFGETGPGYHRSGYRNGRGRRGRGRGRGRGSRYGGGNPNMNGVGGGPGVIGGPPRQDIR